MYRRWACFHPVLLAVFFFASIASAHASLGVLVGEPYGSFGTMMPVGHSALYFDHLCADTPTDLRPCTSGERGAVVARYHRIANVDWLATPVVPFLYGVDNPQQAPAFITPAAALELRERYRQTHLESIVPDRLDAAGNPLPARKGEWTETIGAAFDRRLLLYEFDTTPEQDASLLAWLRASPDRRHYSLLHSNCADFAAEAVNLLYPGAIRRNHPADFGIMTPKQNGRALEAFGLAHPELHLRVYEIPQLPGTLRRSRPLRGAAETFVKTKRYLTFFLVTQPELALADWIIYEDKGKWRPTAAPTSIAPASWSTPVDVAGSSGETVSPSPNRDTYPSRSTSSSTVSEGIGFRAK